MNQEQIAEYKALKAKAELAKAKRVDGYQNRKLVRSTYKEFFMKHATEADKKALEAKLEA